MTAHQKLMLIRHLQRAERSYLGDLQFPRLKGVEEALKECQETIAWVRNLKTEG